MQNFLGSACCGAKVNLTLRITGKLPSGYHSLCSVFMRVGPTDYLTISEAEEDNVRVKFKGIPADLPGRNILLRALDELRENGAALPPLEMCLEKSVPPGTGLGCGSGDAAGLLQLLAQRGVSVDDCARRIGSDVPFLLDGRALALVTGRGENIDFLGGSLDLKTAVVIPRWRCSTAEMYGRADEFYESGWPMDSRGAKDEARRLVRRLRKREFCGLLPNDFAPPLMKDRSEYGELFEAFAARNALAWGITGSGSAAFALWDRESFCGTVLPFPWIENVLIF
ncbi:MAG: 4-(cytidine 5'-diphospho)-2-C-methyl-D-erythritol kinase [Pyramidobacter sp.]|jgi:4-diphosphocytidyl-2-C-methyl-D-erythritol kinase